MPCLPGLHLAFSSTVPSISTPSTVQQFLLASCITQRSLRYRKGIKGVSTLIRESWFLSIMEFPTDKKMSPGLPQRNFREICDRETFRTLYADARKELGESNMLSLFRQGRRKVTNPYGISLYKIITNTFLNLLLIRCIGDAGLLIWRCRAFNPNLSTNNCNGSINKGYCSHYFLWFEKAVNIFQDGWRYIHKYTKNLRT